MDGLNADIEEVRQMGQRGYEEAEAVFCFFRFLGRVFPWLPRKIFPFRVLLSPFPIPCAPLVSSVRTGCGGRCCEKAL
jgi:hypothetical protein